MHMKFLVSCLLAVTLIGCDNEPKAADPDGPKKDLVWGGEETDADADADSDSDTDSDADSDSDADADADSDSDSDSDTDADADPVDPLTTDYDGDGYCEDACSDGSMPGDCDDDHADVYPGAVDIPGDGIDQNCSGADAPVVVPPAVDPLTVDNDGDGYCEDVCSDGSMPGDCDDGNASKNPGEIDVPGDGIDQNCSGADAPVIPGDPDSDGDGWSDAIDCDPFYEYTNPGAPEWCDPNGVYNEDNDCDGLDDFVDPDCAGEVPDPVDPDPADPCDPVDVDLDGYSECGGDCDNGWSGTYPGAPLWCGDGGDHDCNGVADNLEIGCGGDIDPVDVEDDDMDNDGWTVAEGDCDDEGEDDNGDGVLDGFYTHPGMPELWDIRDNDCDGVADNEGLKTLDRCFVDRDDLALDIDGSNGDGIYDQLFHWMVDVDSEECDDLDEDGARDGHGFDLYPLDLCTDPTYAPEDGCDEQGDGTVDLWDGSYALVALSQCIGEDANGLEVAFLFTEDTNDYTVWNADPDFDCDRLGFVLSATGAAYDDLDNSQKALISQHASAPWFNAPEIEDGDPDSNPGDVMYSDDLLEGNPGYSEHAIKFAVPNAF